MKSTQIIGRDRLLISDMKIAPELKKVQKLMPIDPVDREMLRASMSVEGQKDPIRGYYKGRTFLILSGVNRWDVARELKWETLAIETVDVRPRERTEFAIKDQARSREDQRTTPSSQDVRTAHSQVARQQVTVKRCVRYTVVVLAATAIRTPTPIGRTRMCVAPTAHVHG